MKKIFSFLRHQLSLFDAYRNKNRILHDLRSANPTCKIESADLRSVKLGKEVVIHNEVKLIQVQIGDCSYVSKDSSLINVSIGKYCSIGPRALIGLAPHPTKLFVSTYPGFYDDQNTGCIRTFTDKKSFNDSIPATNIGCDVWIGANVIIPGGIKVGDGAIIAAGTVVTKDIPPYAIVGGNPAKEIRKRFTEEQISLLLSLKWWDWPQKEIQEQVDQFRDIDNFYKNQKLN